jgi:hypothetical protein
MYNHAVSKLCAVWKSLPSRSKPLATIYWEAVDNGLLHLSDLLLIERTPLLKLPTKQTDESCLPTLQRQKLLGAARTSTSLMMPTLASLSNSNSSKEIKFKTRTRRSAPSWTVWLVSYLWRQVEAIKQQIKFTKSESVASTRNALRAAREAEETARNTLTKLGDQTGQPPFTNTRVSRS